MLYPLTLLLLGILAGCQAPAPVTEASPPLPAISATAPMTTRPAPAEVQAALPGPPAAAPDGVTTAPVTKPSTVVMDWLGPAAWNDLPGWKDDDLTAAWPALVQSCVSLQKQPPWQDVCRAAIDMRAPHRELIRAFFQRRFAVYQIRQEDGGTEGLITGYYEPLLRGSRAPTTQYRHPLYAPPDDLLIVDLANLYPELRSLRLRGRLDGRKVVPYFTRGEIEAGMAPLKGKEIAWVDDPLELFFLQVQGSGRIQLEDGSVIRVGYADQNGHPYKSIGRWLVDHGEITLDKASLEGIKDWARNNPGRLPELLAANQSYVFFRELANHDGGPLGALGVPLTPERSIAVDPRALPLGAPVWLAATQPNSTTPLNRLVMAQDTGGAIRGNVRADFFWGFGDQAGKQAGAMKQKGRMWLFLPNDYPLTAGDK